MSELQRVSDALRDYRCPDCGWEGDPWVALDGKDLVLICQPCNPGITDAKTLSFAVMLAEEAAL